MRSGWLHRLVKLGRPPTGVDVLLRATLADDAVAADAWRSFERAADLDNLPGVEMCLVGLAAKRLPMLAPASPLRGRVGGIERANWSRMQLMTREAVPALRMLAAHDLAVLTLGDAARAAGGNPIGRGRPVNSIELCVRPGDMPRAHDLLLAHGWSLAGPIDRGRVESRSSLQFRQGRFCVLDLRTSPFPDAASGDGALWRRARPGALGDAPVLIPSATDILAAAVAGGVRRSCFNGLWLADVAMAARTDIDWPLFERESSRHGLDAAAFFSLEYARSRLQRPVPPETLDRLGGSAAGDALRTLTLLVEGRSGAGSTRPARALSAIARRLRRATGAWRAVRESAN